MTALQSRRVSGHALNIIRVSRTYPKVRRIIMDAVCKCGESAPYISSVAVIRAWHRAHKSSVLAASQGDTKGK